MEATLNEKKKLTPKSLPDPEESPGHGPREQNHDLELQWVMSVVVRMTIPSLEEC